MSAPGVVAGVRPHLRSAVLRGRRATAGLRVLPDFVIAGAMKAGTTSLYRYLCAHPDVMPAARKEVHFFDVHYARGPQWYRSMFPTTVQRDLLARTHGRPVLTGEASPYYLFHPLAAERAAGLVPAAKVVVLLRDPVERAWSHYRHEVRAGREPLPFEAALDAEEQRLAGTESLLVHGGPAAVSDEHRYHSYVARGRYAAQLTRWFDAFGREQVLVLRTEDLLHNPDAVWQQVQDFLGLVPARPPAFEVHNAGSGGGGMDASVRARLEAVFAEDDAELARLLSTPLWWPRGHRPSALED
ncbi:MAG: sulfotransferase domain-containing protein [Kineosporiaceae bacterium]